MGWATRGIHLSAPPGIPFCGACSKMRLRWLERPEEPVAPPPPAPQRSLEPARGGRPRLVLMDVETRSTPSPRPEQTRTPRWAQAPGRFFGAAKTKKMMRLSSLPMLLITLLSVVIGCVYRYTQVTYLYAYMHVYETYIHSYRHA